MRIAVWKTGHAIADTVAEALSEGLDAEINHVYQNASDPHWHVWQETNANVHIAYGILRGTERVFKNTDHWFHVDRGYTNPGHYEGNYRISYKGTQAKWHEGIPRKPWGGRLEPMRRYDASKPILFCPPTDAVEEFFGLQDWYLENIPIGAFIKRQKGETRPLEEDLDRCRAVITFNSSVGWEAIRRGIPCLSDVNHSLVGSFYGETDLNKLRQKFHEAPDNRQELFDTMAAHEFTLGEIKQGKAWNLINHYLSSSATTAEKPSPLTCVPTPSKSALTSRFQSNT